MPDVALAVEANRAVSAMLQDSHSKCNHPLDMVWYQRFPGPAQAARALAEHHESLIPVSGAANRSVRKRARLATCRK
jgi:hypothetical protein